MGKKPPPDGGGAALGADAAAAAAAAPPRKRKTTFWGGRPKGDAYKAPPTEDAPPPAAESAKDTRRKSRAAPSVKELPKLEDRHPNEPANCVSIVAVRGRDLRAMDGAVFGARTPRGNQTSRDACSLRAASEPGVLLNILAKFRRIFVSELSDITRRPRRRIRSSRRPSTACPSRRPSGPRP